MAVDGMTFRVARGELFGFLGPNGAGKTTTIKMMMGLVRPTSGRIAMWGNDLFLNPQAAKMVSGYVPDHATLYDKLTGHELLTLVGDLYMVPRDVQVARVSPMIESFELAEHIDNLVQTYSRGMRQKLALCAALIHAPNILLLDEPTVGLDPAGARQLKETLRGLCREGKTVFLSTHVLEIAELLCDRVAIVQKGKLRNMGTPAEMRALSGAESLEAAFLHLTEDGDGLGSVLNALSS